MPWDDLQSEIAELFADLPRVDWRVDEGAPLSFLAYVQREPLWPLILATLDIADREKADRQHLLIGRHGPLPTRTIRIARLTGLDYAAIRRYGKNRRHAAVQTGRSFYFVRRCIKKLRANGLLTDPFPPSDWLDEKLGVATLITDALVAIGVFKRVDNAGGEFRFRVVNASRIDEVVPDGTHVLVFEPAKKRGRPSTRPATLAGAPAGSGPATYAKLVEMNLCAKCGRASRVDGRSRCAPCQQYAREHMKRKTVEG